MNWSFEYFQKKKISKCMKYLICKKWIRFISEEANLFLLKKSSSFMKIPYESIAGTVLAANKIY